MRKVFTRLLAVILLAAVLVPRLPVAVHAAEVSGGVTLKDADAGQLLQFQVSNLFPGDSVTKEYEVTTVHDGPITLHFRADLRPDREYQKLAEVLKVKIQLPEKGVTLYQGLMRDMPNSLSHHLAPSEKKVTYRITVFLDTSVGNAYMNQKLVADFRWWYLEEEVKTPVTLTAEKTMDGQYARGNKFTFELKDEKGQVVDRVKNEDGHIEFDTLYLTAPGTYTYTISEVKGSDPKVTYDNAVYKAIIVLSQDGNAAVSYTRNGAAYTALPRFTNVSKGQPLPEDPSDVRPDNPKTGDTFPLHVMGAISFSSLSALICLFLLWKDKKKEGRA